MHEPPPEPTSVKLELLPPYKQLLVESRQLQTVADLLVEQCQRRIALLNLLRPRLRERSHVYMTFEQERQVYEQEQTHLWDDLKARRLSDERLLVRELEDPLRRQRSSQQVREQYQHLREELHATQELLHEQQKNYRQLRLD
jgi:hypothetical protein